MAAGLSSRFGTPKSLVGIGQAGETLIDYAIHDARRAGFGGTVIVTRPELRKQLERHLFATWPSSAIRFVYQNHEDVPPNAKVSGPRKKPWGTGHAILSARHAIDSPFVAINCDDFYGAAAYQRAAGHFGSGSGVHALVGYTLKDTLSPTGGVSRAVCRSDDKGYLAGLTEILDVQAQNDGITGVTAAGDQVLLDGTETVSLNCWAFQSSIFGHLEREFAEFLSTSPAPDSEFLLSEALNGLIAEKAITVRLLHSDGPWFGITRTDDLNEARRRIKSLTAAGYYPENIASDKLGP